MSKKAKTAAKPATGKKTRSSGAPRGPKAKSTKPDSKASTKAQTFTIEIGAAGVFVDGKRVKSKGALKALINRAYSGIQDE